MGTDQTLTDERVAEICLTLTEAGDQWATVADTLPEASWVLPANTQHRDLVVTEFVRTTGERPAVFYRNVWDAYDTEDGQHVPAGYGWYCTGWSSASHARLWKRHTPPGAATEALIQSLRMQGKLTTASAMFEAAATNPEALDGTFLTDLLNHLGDPNNPTTAP